MVWIVNCCAQLFAKNVNIDMFHSFRSWPLIQNKDFLFINFILLYVAATISKKLGIVCAFIAYKQAWLDEKLCHSLMGIDGQLIRQSAPCMVKT